MYCFVENSTSSANLLVCQLSNYHQCDKTEQFHRYRRKMPLTLETFTQSLKRKMNVGELHAVRYVMLFNQIADVMRV